MIQNFSEKRVWEVFKTKSNIFTVLKINGPFCSIKKRGKNWFPIEFSKCDLDGGDIFSHWKKTLKKSNTLECAQDLVVTWVKLDCVNALLSPGPSLKLKKYYYPIVKKSAQQRITVLGLGQCPWWQGAREEAGTGILSSNSHLICARQKQISIKR